MTENKNDSGWKTALLKARCEWARVLTPFTANWTAGRGAYSIALELSQAQLHRLSQMGFKGVAKPSKISGKFVYNFKRFTSTLKGVPITPLQVLDCDKNPVTELVGDGSLVIVLLEFANYSSGNNSDGVAYPSGVSFRLGGVQVVEHVAYSEEHKNTEEYQKNIFDSFTVQQAAPRVAASFKVPQAEPVPQTVEAHSGIDFAKRIKPPVGDPYANMSLDDDIAQPEQAFPLQTSKDTSISAPVAPSIAEYEPEII